MSRGSPASRAPSGTECFTSTSAQICTPPAPSARRDRRVSAARPSMRPWSVTRAAVCTLTRMQLAPTTAAMARAASASLRSTLIPRGRSGHACRTAIAHAVMALTVTGGTTPAKNGASPKFSIMTRSNPAAARARASWAAEAAISAMGMAARGLPGSAGRCTTPTSCQALLTRASFPIGIAPHLLPAPAVPRPPTVGVAPAGPPAGMKSRCERGPRNVQP